jgi:exopolysaccharide biosynthesis polyprenyl glycosylphosphotransferase
MFLNTDPAMSEITAEKAQTGRVPARDLRALLYAISLCLDCLAVTGGFWTATLVRDQAWLATGDLSIVVITVPLFLMFSIAREVQSVESLQSRSLALSRALSALAATAITCVLLIFVVKEDEVSRFGLGVAFAAAVPVLVVSRLTLDWAFAALMGGKALHCALIIDSIDPPAHPGMDIIDLRNCGLWPDPHQPTAIDKISGLIVNYDRVIVACPSAHRRAWALFLRSSDVGGELVVEDALLQGAVAIGRCGESDTLVMSRGPMALQQRMQKRALDLVLCIPILVFLAPLLVLVAIAIRLDSPGPVFFRQIRVGHGGRQFRIFKFRSMRSDATDAVGERSATRNDDRITRVGALIRRTSIDELPQLLNVLKGDMSLVGPRPHALGSLAGEELFWEVSETYWVRHALKPGITGLAQVRGHRGATAAAEDLQVRLRSDLEYLMNWSLSLDLLILVRTCGVLFHKNAF